MPPLGIFFGVPVRAKIPPELASEASLLTHLGVSAAELRKIWWYRSRMYHEFRIHSASDKVRLISAPDRRLKSLQRRIAALLDKIYSRREPVHGFVRDRSVKTNAAAHLRSKYVLNLDLEKFFPSISEGRVRGLFTSLGINSRVSEILARICCNDGCLPQGAPSSPVISNMVCFRMDRQLMGIARNAHCIYTRYADDITFSSYQHLSTLFESGVPTVGKIVPDLLNADLRSVIQANGFAINAQKAHYADKNSRRTVTGLKVNELVNVDRRYVRNIRAALFAVEKKGLPLAEAEFSSKFGGASKLALHLQGRISWLGHIKGTSDPIYRSVALRFNASFPNFKLPLTPTADERRDRAVWIVEHFEGAWSQGSAFFLSSAGLVTAAHVVEDATEVDVYHPSKPANKFKATVAYFDKHRDLAILKHEIAATEYYELDIKPPGLAMGDTVNAVGYPSYGVGDRLIVKPAVVTSLPIKRAVPYVELSQKLGRGMSGGPLLDGSFRVAGVLHKGGPGEDRDFAVHADELSAWLTQIAAGHEFPQPPPNTSVSSGPRNTPSGLKVLMGWLKFR